MRQVFTRLLLAAALLTLLPSAHAPVSAHVGSPDVYFNGQAGAYHVLVAVRAPAVVPGVAEIDVRVIGATPREVRVVPLRLTGPGAVFAPVPDRATRSEANPRFFTASLWMMQSGPWQVRVAVDGDAGTGQVAIPVDALASRTLRMDPALALMLLPVALFLIFGFIALVGASVGQAQAQPGEPTPPQRIRRARFARALAAVAVVVILALGNWWWDIEAKAYDAYVYKPLQLETSVDTSGRLMLGRLTLALRDPGWLRFRVLDDLVPDHGHPMHLFAIRTPNLDKLFHLHPQPQQQPASFAQPLPLNYTGTYRLFADIVHASGLHETAVGDLTIPSTNNIRFPASLTGDDSEATARVAPDFLAGWDTLFGGGYMVYTREPLKARQLTVLSFLVKDKDGSPARDLSLYMGMPGHAIVVSRDLSVFAHLHPSGTASMASLAMSAATLSKPESGAASSTSSDPHAEHTANPAQRMASPAQRMASPAQHIASTVPLPPTVTFPYGFPKAGDYRIFVQVRRSTGVQTGVFDVRVE